MRKKIAVSDPAELDLVAKQRATFDLEVTWGDGTANLTGDTATFIVRRTPDADPIITATQADDISLGSNGVIGVILEGGVGNDMDIAARVYQYDLVLVHAGAIEPVIQGAFIVKPSMVAT